MARMVLGLWNWPSFMAKKQLGKWLECAKKDKQNICSLRRSPKKQIYIIKELARS